MDSRQLLAEALRLSDEERAALAGELIQSLEHEVDAEAEAAWSAEIRARLDRVDAGTSTTVPWSEARRRSHAAAQRGPRHLEEAGVEAAAAAEWYAARSATAAAGFEAELVEAESPSTRCPTHGHRTTTGRAGTCCGGIPLAWCTESSAHAS
jgi:putative addiction module component (TIGR02574 family)